MGMGACLGARTKECSGRYTDVGFQVSQVVTSFFTLSAFSAILRIPTSVLFSSSLNSCFPVREGSFSLISKWLEREREQEWTKSYDRHTCTCPTLNRYNSPNTFVYPCLIGLTCLLFGRVYSCVRVIPVKEV